MAPTFTQFESLAISDMVTAIHESPQRFDYSEAFKVTSLDGRAFVVSVSALSALFQTTQQEFTAVSSTLDGEAVKIVIGYLELTFLNDVALFHKFKSFMSKLSIDNLGVILRGRVNADSKIRRMGLDEILSKTKGGTGADEVQLEVEDDEDIQ